jgi:hypothetical protein
MAKARYSMAMVSDGYTLETAMVSNSYGLAIGMGHDGDCYQLKMAIS